MSCFNASLFFNRRWKRLVNITFLVGGTFSIAGFFFFTSNSDSSPHFGKSTRTLLQYNESYDSTFNLTNWEDSEYSDPLFPPDLFTQEQRYYQGAIAYHIFGMLYMFAALAVVSAKFFVPSIEVIIEKFHITEDVAGATFMAAGRSTPKLFTSVIGIFISYSDVGIGTIVGSAVFNILIVIAMCAFFSKSVLELTGWPLFRDITFYAIAIILLVMFFLDSNIHWYEALALFLVYVLYCIFLKFNENIKNSVKKYINKGNVTSVQPITNNQTPFTENPTTGSSQTQFGAGDQNVIPLVPLDPTELQTNKLYPDIRKEAEGTELTDVSSSVLDSQTRLSINNIGNNLEEESKPIDMSWPDTTLKRITYILLAPIIFPLSFTLPDPKTPRGKRFFFVPFFGSIIWIAIFSYLMVWWGSVVGETLGIPHKVMGLTILAIGTSVPDLITSVIVARKGFGDMAVSSSNGSNIFSVCCGLPIPWLFHALAQFIKNKANPQLIKPITVSSDGMACSVQQLFTMIIFVLISIVCCRWKINICLGVIMVLLYLCFIVTSLSFEYGLIVCPI